MKGCLRSILFFAFAIVIINVIILAFQSSSTSGDPEYYRTGSVCDEFLKADQNTGDHSHQREWQVYERPQSFCIGYETLDSVRNQEALQRDQLRVGIYEENFWGSVYRQLVNEGRHHLDYLADSLRNVAFQKNLSRNDLARLTVSFVQDIPYSYVIPISCAELETYGKPCLGDIPYGIIGPYEFAHSLYGDCDTRAVLLYVLLENLKFDPMIVVSDKYAHAMIALNIPAQGDYISYAGNKYYFWETTAAGWQLGMLPPDTNNINYWEIALVNEL